MSRVARRRRGRAKRRIPARHAQRPVRVAVVGRACNCSGSDASCSPPGSRSPASSRSRPARSCSSAAYFGLLTGGVTQVLMLLPDRAQGHRVGALDRRGRAGARPRGERGQARRRRTCRATCASTTSTSATRPGSRRRSTTSTSTSRPARRWRSSGRPGSGKSTLLNLALGFLRPTRGRMLLDGVEWQQPRPANFRRFVSVVPQESVLFEGSIRENIAYGLGEVTDERVLAGPARRERRRDRRRAARGLGHRRR